MTARFENVPANHDGSSVFRLRLAFSKEVFDGSERFDKNQAIQDALVVNGGVVTGRRRVDRNEFDEWWFKVAPSGNGAVTVSLPAQTDCGAAGAVCTPDGAALESPVSATVPGPVSQTREVSITAANSSMIRSVTADSSQVTEGMAAEFTLTRTGSLADALTVDVSVTETGTMLSSTVPKAVTFNANSPTAELRVETEDDEVAEPASAVSAALAAGSGYSVDAGAAAATVTVEDDDAAPVVQAAVIVTVPENTTAVAALTATDDDTPVADLGWSIVSGADAAMFAVSAGGDLAFASAKDFEAPDDADKDGDYEVTVRVTDGANAVDAALTVRLADVDDVSPVLTGANVNGDALTLTFGERLDGGSVPAASAFSVTVDETARGISDVSLSGGAVTLTLASAVVSGETVTVGYTVPTGANARPLRDAAENAVAGFTDEAVTNDTPSEALVGIYSLSRNWSEVAGSNFRVRLVRYGDTSEELTVNVSVTETGSMLVETPPSTFAFAAGEDEVDLEPLRSSLFEDDLIDEPDSEVTITILTGTGYRTSDTLWGGPSLTITVRDDDWSPEIMTESPVLVAENRTAIKQLAANRRVYALLADRLSWSLVGGADEDKLTLSAGGALAFKTAKDFEAPDDADTDGDYEIEVRVTDAAGNSADASLTIRLTDVSATATGKPAISGTVPQVGNVLTATRGTINDDDGVPGTFTYQWVRVDGDSESAIAGARSSTYTLSTADVGKQIKVKISFTDNDGNAEGPLASEAYPASGSVVAASRACPSDADWCATMTVDADVSERTEFAGGSYYRGYFEAGSLSDDTVSHGGIDYTVASFYRTLTIMEAYESTDDRLVIEVSGGALPDGTVFTIAGVALTVGADSFYDTASQNAFERWIVDGHSVPAWFQGQKVTASLKFPANSPPAGLPTISGSAEVGSTLTASADGIEDDEGLTNATFAWQWIASEENSDTDIAGATGSTYTLTSAEVGKTIKVRVTFTDDGGTEETLVSEATAAVTAALPSVSVAAVSSPVTEGTAASFRLSRSGATAPALTVAVSVTVEGAVVSATPASSVTFAAGSAEATLNVATVDDSVAEADARVSVSVTAGPGYLVGNGSGSARVDVYDNDEVASAPVETLWTSTLEWQGDYGAGWVNANEEDFSSPGWSEDGDDYRIWYIAYGSSSGELWVRADPNMRAGGIPASGELTLQVGQVIVDSAGTMARFARGDIAVVRGIEPSWAVGEQVQVRLTRTTAGETTVSGPGVSVADAQVQEAEGAVLAFRVTLAEAQTSAVSVRYATSDGTATAGTDYVSVSGALRFAPGETAKTVSVPVLNDAHDDDGETMTLTLLNPFGAQIADGTATGTITNSDPLQKMWLARFGRTVALQTIDALEGRFAVGSDASPRMTMTVAGQSVDLAQIGDDRVLAETMMGLARAFGAPGAPAANDNDPFARHGFGEAGNGAGVSAPARPITGRDLLLGSSFHFTTGEASGLGGAMTGWGKVLSGGSSGSFGGGLSFASETATGVLGMDWERDRLLVGVALSRSVEKGSASFGPTDLQYDIEGSLSMVTPYLRVRAGDRLSFWSAVGSGSGSMSLSRGGGLQTADIDMQLAAAGGRAELLRPGADGGLALALKTDAFFVRAESARVSTPGVGNLAAATGDASRLRAVLEGSRAFALSDGGALAPSLSVGLRHDGGDAETGSGVEIGAGLSWSAPAAGLTSDLRLYGLAAHEAGGYDEWGASGSLRMVPGPTGRGLSLSMTPSWGARGETGRLWNAAPGGLAGDGGSEPPGMRFDTELGYGLPLSGGLTGTPYAGFGFGEAGARDYRLGWRFASDRLRSLTLGIETTRREAANDNGAGGRPEHGVTLRAGLRW